MKRWLVPILGQDIYKMSLGHLVVLESKEVLNKSIKTNQKKKIHTYNNEGTSKGLKSQHEIAPNGQS